MRERMAESLERWNVDTFERANVVDADGDVRHRANEWVAGGCAR